MTRRAQTPSIGTQGWDRIPDYIWASVEEIGLSGIVMLLALSHHLNRRTGLCCPSIPRLAKMLQISERHAVRVIKKLAKA